LLRLDPGDLVGAVGNPPTQGDVQANRDKINELMANLRLAGILGP